MEALQVNQKESGTRLDLFLAARMKISRKKAKLWIDEGRVFLKERKIIIASWEVQVGDQITLQDPNTAVLPRKQRYLDIMFEDADVIVVEKPTGVACERSAQTLTATLVDDLNDYLKRAHPDRPHPYVGLMHRLDRETSGLMVYTVSKRANSLSQQFKDHTIGRRYLTIVEGALDNGSGRIDKPIRKDPLASGKKMQVFQSRSKHAPGRALTDYRVLERYPKVSLVEARLLTGKTHQVRVHFASLGHPVVGDRLYGSTLAAPRHLLHASQLDFLHPITGKKLSFRSEPPKDFKKFLEKYRASSLSFKNFKD